MMLMYPAGLRLIATLSLIATPLNLVASIIVSPSLGAPGPLYVSIVVALFLQTIPAMVHLRRHGIVTTPDATAMAPIPAADDQALLVDAGLAPVGRLDRGPAVPRPHEDLVLPPVAPPAPRTPLVVAAPAVDPVELQPLVQAAVEQALAHAIVHLRLAPTVLPGPTPGILDGMRQVVDRIDRQAAQIDDVVARLNELAIAMDAFTEATDQLAANQAEIDAPPGAWPDILQGGEDAIRAADSLSRAVRDRRRRLDRGR